MRGLRGAGGSALRVKVEAVGRGRAEPAGAGGVYGGGGRTPQRRVGGWWVGVWGLRGCGTIEVCGWVVVGCGCVWAGAVGGGGDKAIESVCDPLGKAPGNRNVPGRRGRERERERGGGGGGGAVFMISEARASPVKAQGKGRRWIGGGGDPRARLPPHAPRTRSMAGRVGGGAVVAGAAGGANCARAG